MTDDPKPIYALPRLPLEQGETARRIKQELDRVLSSALRNKLKTPARSVAST